MGYWSNGYYYRRRGEYLGTGEVAELTAIIDADARNEARLLKDEARHRYRSERSAFHEARQGAAGVDAMVSRGLGAVGFHRQFRHQWRKRKSMTVTLESPVLEAATFELAELVEKCYVAAYGAQRAVGLEDKLQSLRADLAGPHPTPAIQIAVDAAVHAWLDMWTVELIAAGDPLRVSPVLDRRRNWSQRRFAQALVTVERIRHLSRPRAPLVAIQVVAGAASEQALTARNATPKRINTSSDLSST